jgi:hypothetical protein
MKMEFSAIKPNVLTNDTCVVTCIHTHTLGRIRPVGTNMEQRGLYGETLRKHQEVGAFTLLFLHVVAEVFFSRPVTITVLTCSDCGFVQASDNYFLTCSDCGLLRAGDNYFLTCSDCGFLRAGDNYVSYI